MQGARLTRRETSGRGTSLRKLRRTGTFIVVDVVKLDRMDLVARQLSLLSLSVFALSYLFLHLLSLALPLFDKSPLLIPHLLPSPLLRWDLFHFLHIAHSGYIYEHEWAFLPGAPAVIHHLSPVPLFLVLAFVICDSSRTLYQLSMLHLQSHSLAYLSVILSLLSSSPVAMHLVPYSEPFFTYLSYKGKLRPE
jgi:phosphatidylinositol glycan class V